MSTLVRERLGREGHWLALCRAGDRAAWRALYDQHLPLVHRVARRLGVSPADLGDVCQEVFLRVFRGLPGFGEQAQFTTWLYSIVAREALRAQRRRAVRRAFEALLGRQPPPVPSDPVARLEATWELDRILARLKPKQRQAFVLFDLEELPLEQVAVVLGCPLETVRSRLRHARAEFTRLRQRSQLAGEGGR